MKKKDKSMTKFIYLNHKSELLFTRQICITIYNDFIIQNDKSESLFTWQIRIVIFNYFTT